MHIILPAIGALCVILGLFFVLAVYQTMTTPSNGTSGGLGVVMFGAPAAAFLLSVGAPLLYPPMFTATALGMGLVIAGVVLFVIGNVLFWYFSAFTPGSVIGTVGLVVAVLGFLTNLAVLLNGS